MQGTTFRCSNCGAPLQNVEGGKATCGFCAAENHVGLVGTTGGAAIFAQAAREADAMIRDNESKLAELQATYSRLMEEAITTGSSEIGQQALHAFEAYLRLTYAPTIHMYRSMSPADPAVSRGIEEIDRAIADALASLAQALP